jgi:hypothetical protein
VCCHVEVSATSWSLVQRSPTDCDAVVCDLETSWMRRTWPPGGCRARTNKNLEKSTNYEFHHAPCYFHLGPHFLSTLSSNTLRLRAFIRAEHSVLHPRKTGKMTVPYITFFVCFDRQAIPVAGLDRPWGSKTAWHEGDKVVTGRLYPPGNIPATHLCYKLSQPQV